MSKNFRTIIFSIVVVAVIVLMENFLFRLYIDRDDKQTNISMILYEDGKNWDDIKAGATKAAGDDADINYITLYPGATSEVQFDTITAEFDKGADYVVVAAINSTLLEEQLGSDYDSRVSFILNGTANSRYVTVQPDNYQMGINVGNLVAKEEGAESKIAIINSSKNNIYMSERVRGVEDALTEAGLSFEVWDNVTEDGKPISITGKIVGNHPDVVIVLNEEAVAGAIEAYDVYGGSISLYAIANSDEAVYYLDKGKIKYLVYPDDYGMGYASIKRVLNKNAYVNNDFKNLISYKIVSRSDMYTGEYEKVLFPFVK